jgi:hypothetical protein
VGKPDSQPATISRLVAAAIAAHPSEGRFVALAIRSDDPLADVARVVFAESSGSDTATLIREYVEYRSASLFFLVMDRKTGRPAGAGRVVEGGGRTLDDAPDRIGRDLSAIVAAHDLQDGKIWELAPVSVLPGYHGGRAGSTVSSLLYRTILKAGRRAGVRHVVALLDQRALRRMALLGIPFVPMAGSGPFEYRGSVTRALYVPFAGLEPSIAEQGERLRRPGADFAGEIRARGLCRLLTRRHAARRSAQVATGTGLDEHIQLPGLDRRRLPTR